MLHVFKDLTLYTLTGYNTKWCYFLHEKFLWLPFSTADDR